MTYCKDYCEEKGISTSKLNEVQKTLYYTAENMKTDESISEEGYRHFQIAIKALEQEGPKWWIPISECERMKDGQEIIVLTNDDYVARDLVIRDEHGIWLAGGYDLKQIAGWIPLPGVYREESEVE